MERSMLECLTKQIKRPMDYMGTREYGYDLQMGLWIGKLFTSIWVS